MITKIRDLVENSPYRDKLLSGDFGDKYGVPSGIRQIRDNFRNREDLEELRKSGEGKELDKLFKKLEDASTI